MKFKDYYDRTSIARDDVIQSLTRNKKVQMHELQSIVMMKCGLGKRWLDELVEILIKSELIEVKGDVITWIGQEARK